MSSLDNLSITNRYAEFPDSFYTRVAPQPLANTRWVVWNDELASLLHLPSFSQIPEELLANFDGSKVWSQFKPLAMKYTGHQFGVYNPDLGDGRGLLLGEIEGRDGAIYDIHLKGAGTTPYSRMGDGRAVLRSSIREYLAGEAMAALGIPTTRSLGLISSDTPVYREQQETGALLLRVAETHIRFGHFEYFFHTNQHKELKLLADKVIQWHFPSLANSKASYAEFFRQVVERTAKMIAHWQAVGFAHGVMNTDNMSILGQTFDYGPYGFIDDFESGYICNHSDHTGRYAFDQQPRIGLWNLSALAYALSPLISSEELQSALGQYENILSQQYYRLMRSKLGLNVPHEDDGSLIQGLLAILETEEVDYTFFFRQLSYLDSSDKAVVELFKSRAEFSAWLEQYLKRTELDNKLCNGEGISMEQRCQAMRLHNPKYILRNYLLQNAIERAEQGDYSEVHLLANLLSNPFDEQSDYDDYAKLPPVWGKKMKLSCSS
ncbi:protein adenylyltransferase SelO [Vibrio marisflavi]|uniref:Protein nucleotidyltransferase YdiU n=1 Tax=Vibrio marisflavi CECT 7928 TaxID=634439 RepID=A0ABN8E2H5_9VIBR|nr:YdiU family protein [Vibrio marisflavi]CAH0539383.1 Protein adenylyltransferase SelO [Vibrio marisflavi CECT 7928]